mmetsp:Transcript_4049/g.5202  ORF Transcript_4049/g.5202 Transcript_4049/m.5202 type:complete len:137 (-) Transcript_4049:1106-1516(-)
MASIRVWKKMGNAIQNEADHHPASDSGKTTDKKAPVSEVAEAKQKTGFYKRWNDGMVNLKLLDKKHSQKLFFDEDDIDVEEAMENEINAAWTLMSFALYSKKLCCLCAIDVLHCCAIDTFHWPSHQPIQLCWILPH